MNIKIRRRAKSLNERDATGSASFKPRLLVECLRSPGVKDVLVKAGVEPLGNSPEGFTLALRSELARWNKVIRAAGIKPE